MQMTLKKPALDPLTLTPRTGSGYPEPYRSRVLPREKRALGDPLGQLTTREAILVQGEAAQTSTMRWQDYTQTAVDPSDDCTIWYVGDYVKKDASSYSSRIGAFRIPGCTP